MNRIFSYISYRKIHLTVHLTLFKGIFGVGEVKDGKNSGFFHGVVVQLG